jgi:hypothetical protein
MGWFATGTWTAGSDDDVVVDDTTTGSGATLTTLGPTDGTETVTARIAYTGVSSTGNGFKAFGVVDDYDHTVPAGVACQLVTNGQVNLFDVEPGTQLGSAAFTVTSGDTFQLAETRDTGNFMCAAIDSTLNTNASATGTTTTEVVKPEVGIRIHSTQISVKWLMVVTH